MEAQVICLACRGSKLSKGMGGIMKPCRACKGAGFIKEAILPVTTPTEKQASVTLEMLGNNPDSSAPAPAPLVTQINSLPPAKKPEQEMGDLMGYTPFMVEAILAEPKMPPLKWREKYQSILNDPLAVNIDVHRQVLPDSRQRAQFRENLARKKKAAPRKVNVMKTQDIAGNMEGLE